MCETSRLTVPVSEVISRANQELQRTPCEFSSNGGLRSALTGCGIQTERTLCHTSSRKSVTIRPVSGQIPGVTTRDTDPSFQPKSSCRLSMTTRLLVD